MTSTAPGTTPSCPSPGLPPDRARRGCAGPARPLRPAALNQPALTGLPPAAAARPGRRPGRTRAAPAVAVPLDPPSGALTPGAPPRRRKITSPATSWPPVRGGSTCPSASSPPCRRATGQPSATRSASPATYSPAPGRHRHRHPGTRPPHPGPADLRDTPPPRHHHPRPAEAGTPPTRHISNPGTPQTHLNKGRVPCGGSCAPASMTRLGRQPVTIQKMCARTDQVVAFMLSPARRR